MKVRLAKLRFYELSRISCKAFMVRKYQKLIRNSKKKTKRNQKEIITK